MLLWVLLAVLTAGTVIAVIAPLARAKAQPAPAAAHDLAVYRDQMAELEHDRERGLIGDAEADAARTEIARRLLKAGSAASTDAPVRTWGRSAAVAVAVVVPVMAVAFYNVLGSPDLPAQPLEARLQAPGDPDNIADMIARVEAHLVNNPEDVNGWRVLAPVYRRIGRFEDAAGAYRRVMRADGETPQLQEDLADALIGANGGLVSEEAQAAADAAVTAEPDRVRARFFRALGNAQAGKAEPALVDFDEIIRRSPANAPWLPTVLEERGKALVALGRSADTPAPETRPATAPAVSGAPGPGAADVAAAAQMSETDRRAMIDGMVQQLADRLAEDPADAEGWQRLIRAYAVMDRKDDAIAAYAKARETFKGDDAVLAALDGVARDVGLVN